MRYPVSTLTGHCRRGLALVTVLLAGACGQPPTPAAAPATAGEIRNFTGTWSFTGNRQLMPLAAGDQAAIFSVSGSLLLAGRERPTLGFRAEIIGFSDSQTGMVGTQRVGRPARRQGVQRARAANRRFPDIRSRAASPGEPDVTPASPANTALPGSGCPKVRMASADGSATSPAGRVWPRRFHPPREASNECTRFPGPRDPEERWRHSRWPSASGSRRFPRG